jgi:hypothetical protein
MPGLLLRALHARVLIHGSLHSANRKRKTPLIALFGSNGSIGRRYQAILNDLGVPYKTIEVEDTPNLDKVTKAIIATPTPTHYGLSYLCQAAGVPFLCEKPLSKDMNELRSFQKFYTMGFVVNNYAFLQLPKKIELLEYDFFNTGRDGLLWDICQLIYLSELHESKLLVRRKSWKWTLKVNHCPVAYASIEQSYMDMIEAFINYDIDQLWSLKDGIDMSKLIFKLEGSLRKEITNEGFFRNSSSYKLQPISGEDLQENRTQRTHTMEL